MGSFGAASPLPPCGRGWGTLRPCCPSEGSILWPRSYTAGCYSLGAVPSCPCAWVMTSMSWGEWDGGELSRRAWP